MTQPLDTDTPDQPPTQNNESQMEGGEQLPDEERSDGSLQWSMGDTTFLANANADFSATAPQQIPPPQHAAPPRQPTGPQTRPNEQSHQNESNNQHSRAPLLPDSLLAALTDLSTKVDQTAKISEEKEELQRKLAALTDKNRDLEQQLQKSKQELKTCLSKLEDREQSLAIERSLRIKLEHHLGKTTTKGDLVIGSSIIRDLDEDLYHGTTVISQSGAIPDDLTHTLKELAKDDQKYDRVMIVAGGNQLQDDIANVTETISSIKSTIAAAKQVGDTVSLCELPPRMNSINATEAVHALNIELKELARETECGYVETGQVFHLANGSPNDGYMDKDNIHINLRGGDKLVECLQIKLKEQNRKVTKFAAYNKKNNHPQQKKQQPKSYSKVAAGMTQKPTGSVAPKQFAPAPQGKHESKSKTIQAGRQPIADPKRKDDGRPLPIQEEFDFCGYCGEPGHRYWNCRCGGPVKCNKCGVSSHKAKFCHHYD